MRTGDTEEIHTLLAVGEVVDDPDELGTPLRVAMLTGDVKAAGIFLDAGADIETAVQPEAVRSLYAAVRRGQAALVALLIAHGVNVGARDAMGWTPLLSAARTGKVAVAELLLAHGADVNEADTDGGYSPPFCRPRPARLCRVPARARSRDECRR